MQHSFLLARSGGARVLANATAITLGYFATAYLSLRFIVPGAYVALIWPPGGLLFAALLLRPRSSWPLTMALGLLANLAANSVSGRPLNTNVGFSVVNVLEALLAAALLGRGSDTALRLQTLRDMLRLMLGALVAAMLSGLLGAAVPALMFGAPFWGVWRIWWVAHSLGIAVIGGLIVAWVGGEHRVAWGWARWAEAGVLATVLGAVCLALLGAPDSKSLFFSPALIYVVLMWAVLRFHTQGASVAVACVSGVVLLATLDRRGPFSMLALPYLEQVLQAQVYACVLGFSSLALAALTWERQQVQERLRQANSALELRVAERTAALIDANTHLHREAERRRETAWREQSLRAEAQAARLHLEQVLAGISDQIVVLDRAWRYTFVNDRVTEITRLRREDMLGRTIWEVFPRTLGTAFEHELRRAAAEQVPIHFELCYPPQNRWFEHRVYPAASGLTMFVAEITERKLAEGRLRESEAKLQAALDGGQLGTWSWNPATNEVLADRRVLDLFGLDPVLRSDNLAAFFAHIHPDDREAVHRSLQQAQQLGRQYEAEFRVALPSGQVRWLAGVGRPQADAGGQVREIYGVYFDITERKWAERHSAFLLELDKALALLSDAEAIERVAVERLGTYLDLACCTFGQISGKRVTVLEVYRHDNLSVSGSYDLDSFLLPAALEPLLQGRALVVDDVATDPRTAPVAEQYHAFGLEASVVTPVVYQGQWVGVLAVMSMRPRAWRPDEVQLLYEVAARVWPLAEQARARVALRASEARLQVLYVQEQAARAQAEEANRLKDEFLATVSHELRTPLTAFLGYAELLQGRAYSDAYLASTLEKIVQRAQAQARLIDDLLDASRIVSGKLQIEPRPMDLSLAIHAALDTVHPAVEAKGLRLHIDIDPAAGRISGDVNRLQQVVWNLLSNAIKFTPSGGSIQVRLAPAGGEVELTISDTGQGIRPDFLPLVFERFRQDDSPGGRAQGGLGLGLAIVRHLVELHGGTVRVASPGKGQGATFTVRLPLLGAGRPAQPGDEAARAPAAEGGPPDLRGLRVLLVDDQPDILELLRDTIAPCGALVMCCATAREALETVRSWLPEVLVSDIAMPGEDGYWLIRAVRELGPERGGSLAAVALTAHVRAEDRARVLAAGFQRYMPKPVKPSELRALLADLARPLAAER
jgi:PAS domain S-box-containing protein